jgi:chemotaxis protein CheD
MLHESAIDRNRAGRNPFTFADTGIPLLFERCYALGGEKRRMIVRVAGGAAVMDENGVFNIGRRNYLALRRILWKAGVLVEAEEVGGTISRTVRLEMGSGRFLLKGGAEAEREIRRHRMARAEGAMA